MRQSLIYIVILLLALSSYLALPDTDAKGGELTVMDVSPTARSLTAPADSSIIIQFDRAVDRDTVDKDSFWAFGRWSGPSDGAFGFSDGDRQVTLTPARPFSAGEQVMVILANSIAAQDGSSLRDAGYSFQFWVGSAPAETNYGLLDTLSTRTEPNTSTRAYGGVATDFNDDGWLDISIVNEDTADLRVFLNQADGSGNFDDFLQPPTAINMQASPSEPSDFNRDGLADLAVANIAANTVSVLLGLGDGTFEPQQEITVGAQPRGIAVLDVDGDGDTDIVNTNSGGSGDLSVLLNDGGGVFGAPTFFEGGANGEWALAAADMNEDAILDLVVGARNANEILVNAGQGDGTFQFASSQSAGGAVWMLNVADVNGDGHDDVATANSTSGNGAILVGDGAGNLAAPQITFTDPFPLATDLGDVDGDGDLDWATSSFLGDWLLFLNDGQGNFTLDQSFTAPEAASCVLMLDFDNDGDLDLALIDELADVVILMKNLTDPDLPTPTPTATEEVPTSTPTLTPTSTSTATPTSTLTPTPTSTSTATATPTLAPSSTATPTLVPSPTPTFTSAQGFNWLPIILYQLDDS